MLKIGVIGMSDGNGHPYSWSSIINGDFNSEAMKDCGSPVIPVYLEANRDTLGIDGAKVTHVWCKEGRDIAEHCAQASLIDNAIDNMEDMIGQVDAVLLAVCRSTMAGHIRCSAINSSKLSGRSRLANPERISRTPIG